MQGQLVVAHGLEGGGAGADRADGELPHAVDHGADAGEDVDLPGEFGGKGVADVGLEGGEADAELPEHVHDGELAAEGVPALLEAHPADLVGIGLDEDGLFEVAEGGHRPVFVPEIGQAQNGAVHLVLVFLQKGGIALAVGLGLHRAVLGQAPVHGHKLVAGPLEGFGHLLAGGVHQLAGEKAAVGKIEGKFHDLSPCMLVFRAVARKCRKIG